MIPALLHKVLRDLSQRRTRSALTILGIAVGVAGLVAIISTSSNVVQAQRELFANTSQADLTYWVWDAPPNLIPLLQADPRIAAAELRLTYVTRWRSADSWMDIEFVGLTDFQQVTVNHFDLVEGQFPTLGQVLLEESASRPAGIGPGAEIAYRDQQGRERYLQVSGISRSPSYLSSAITNMATGYVPASFLRRMLDIGGSNQLLIKLRAPQDATRVAEQVSRLLRQQGLSAGAPEVRDADQFPGKRELDALIILMFIFSVLGILLSVLLVINTLSASIAEQTNEIGILKSIGATRTHVLLVYLLEALMYGFIGTGLGVILGVMIGWRLLAWIGSLGNASIGFRVSPQGIGIGCFVGVGMSLLGGLFPALRGMRVPIKEALESYGIRADYGEGRWDRMLKRIRHLPPLVALATRNLGRRKARTTLTVLVVALSTAAFLSAMSTRDSVNVAITGIYATYGADAWVWLNQNVSSQFEQQFQSVEGVYTAEGWQIANGIVRLADARLWGIPPRSVLYRQVMREGRWFRSEEPDAVVLSAELADDQHVHVGESVEIQVNGQSRWFTVVGIAIDNTIFLGGTLSGKAFLPRASLGRLLGQGDSVSFFALGLGSREPKATDRILADVELKFQAWKPSVQPVYREIEAARASSRLLTLALFAMVIIVALIGALGILNTLTLSVLERRREIAVMRAIGATDVALILTFVGEGLAFGGTGWLIGLLMGYPAGRLFTAQLGRVLFTLGFVFSPRTVLLSAIFALALAIVASLGPALGAAHTRASSALRYE